MVVVLHYCIIQLLTDSVLFFLLLFYSTWKLGNHNGSGAQLTMLMSLLLFVPFPVVTSFLQSKICSCSAPSLSLSILFFSSSLHFHLWASTCAFLLVQRVTTFDLIFCRDLEFSHSCTQVLECFVFHFIWGVSYAFVQYCSPNRFFSLFLFKVLIFKKKSFFFGLCYLGSSSFIHCILNLHSFFFVVLIVKFDPMDFWIIILSGFFSIFP